MDLEDIRWAMLPASYVSAYVASDFYVTRPDGVYELSVFSIGSFRLYVNGIEVKRHISTGFDSFDATSNTFYSYKCDIGRYLNDGFNRIGLLLCGAAYMEKDVDMVPTLRCAFALEHDGELIHSSTEGMLFKRSHILMAAPHPEVQDFDYFDPKWSMPMNIDGFSTCDPGEMVEGQEEKIDNSRDADTIEKPEAMIRENEKTIYDLESMFMGPLTFRCDSDDVVVRVAEGELGSDVEEAEFIKVAHFKHCKPGQVVETELPSFGFRFVEVAGGELLNVKILAAAA